MQTDPLRAVFAKNATARKTHQTRGKRTLSWVACSAGALVFLLIALGWAARSHISYEAAKIAADISASARKLPSNDQGLRSDAERKRVLESLNSELDGMKRQLEEIDALTDASTRMVGATVDNWLSFPSSAKQLMAEGWIREVLPTRADDLGDRSISLAAIDLVVCIDTTVKGMDSLGETLAAEIGAMCILQLWG